MIIEDISLFKGSMMCVELTGGQLAQNMKIYLHSEIVSAGCLKRGMEISEQETDSLIYQNDLRRARERALYLLEHRDYSYSELYDKLEENYDENICFEICGRMTQLRLIDDRRYAEKLCRQLFDVKKLGSYRVRAEMRRRGIPDGIISDVMESFEEENDSLERLEELVEKKYERYLTDRKGVNKVKSALARKGYSYEEINEVLGLYDLDFSDYD